MADENRGRHDVLRFRGPGRGGRAADHPKGRQVDPDALDQVIRLLGDMPRRRDLLIEALSVAGPYGRPGP